MGVQLKKAEIDDAEQLFAMQRAAFLPLLEKYRDYATSPANEPIEKMKARIREQNGGFFKILAGGELAGAIRIRQKEAGRFWIGPLFITPQFQGGGIAQAALLGAEALYPKALSWHLATLVEEQGNCRLYEKMGYRRIGMPEKLNALATLVYYEKLADEKNRDAAH